MRERHERERERVVVEPGVGLKSIRELGIKIDIYIYTKSIFPCWFTV